MRMNMMPARTLHLLETHSLEHARAPRPNMARAVQVLSRRSTRLEAAPPRPRASKAGGQAG